ncbi:MAG: hypothetical protein QXU18_09155 [Thermoplasmatales archaeon]
MMPVKVPLLAIFSLPFYVASGTENGPDHDMSNEVKSVALKEDVTEP